MKKYWTRDREAGNRIEWFATEQEAVDAIEAYEDADRKDGTYEKDFYEVFCEEEN